MDKHSTNTVQMVRDHTHTDTHTPSVGGVNLSPVSRCRNQRKVSKTAILASAGMIGATVFASSLLFLIIPSPWKMLSYSFDGFVAVSAVSWAYRGKRAEECGCRDCIDRVALGVYANRLNDREEAERYTRELMKTLVRRLTKDRLLKPAPVNVPGASAEELDALERQCHIENTEARWVVVTKADSQFDALPSVNTSKASSADLLMGMASDLSPWIATSAQAAVLHAAEAHTDVDRSKLGLQIVGPFDEITATAVEGFITKMGPTEAVKIARAVVAP